MSDVTIVIPNYNGIAFLKTCLDSVLAQTGVQMDVIIIDNGSVDGSQEFISSNYPQCELQSTKVSTGQKARMSYC